MPPRSRASTLEARSGAGGAFARTRSGIEATAPLACVALGRIAGAQADAPVVDISAKDQPAFLVGHWDRGAWLDESATWRRWQIVNVLAMGTWGYWRRGY